MTYVTKNKTMAKFVVPNTWPIGCNIMVYDEVSDWLVQDYNRDLRKQVKDVNRNCSDLYEHLVALKESGENVKEYVIDILYDNMFVDTLIDNLNSKSPEYRVDEMLWIVRHDPCLLEMFFVKAHNEYINRFADECGYIPDASWKYHDVLRERELKARQRYQSQERKRIRHFLNKTNNLIRRFNYERMHTSMQSIKLGAEEVLTKDGWITLL